VSESMDTSPGLLVDTIRTGMCDCFQEVEIVQLETAHNLGASLFGGWVVRHMDSRFAHLYTYV
jgi:acyl-CoA hydrolase